MSRFWAFWPRLGGLSHLETFTWQTVLRLTGLPYTWQTRQPAKAGHPTYHVNVIKINNGNWTEWSSIWAEIIREISQSNECSVRVQFEIIIIISDQNCTTRGSITTSLHPFWNRPNTRLGQFKYFIDVVLSWFEIKFIHFLGRKIRVLETKVAKFATWYSLSFIFLQFDWLL